MPQEEFKGYTDTCTEASHCHPPEWCKRCAWAYDEGVPSKPGWKTRGNDARSLGEMRDELLEAWPKVETRAQCMPVGHMG